MLRNSQHLSSGSSHVMSLQSLLKYLLIASLLSSAAVLLLAGVGAWLGLERLIRLDSQIQQIFYLHSQSRLSLLPYTSFITALGSFKISAFAAAGFALLCFLQRHPRTTMYGYIICASFAMMWILNTLLKEIFRRSRPELDHLLVVHGYSYPSGHAMISMGFYGMLFVIWATEWRGRDNRWIPMLCGTLFVLLIGISRIMLGVHYPTDVFAGFAAGLVWISCMIRGMNRSLA
ncbi:phosphatase PAP2 family protein [Paenibacillus polysaccharolyticus]|uniref:phosphatase PAP2 family protein n=1 Tax=Paenibacillus polysaccharolyticus TaxID=582692 RepID=UPI00203C9660|nr:phosphatase PAP2 family protein [Paenibacillus polysaccharolyticus]MCM3136403.1 phosphatase PAP2 family protein [Paenibacillus polysaccharolyticus]